MDNRLNPHAAAAEVAIVQFLAAMEQHAQDAHAQKRISIALCITAMPPFIREQARWEDDGVTIEDRLCAFINLIGSLIGTFIRSNALCPECCMELGDALDARLVATIKDFLAGAKSPTSVEIIHATEVGHA